MFSKTMNLNVSVKSDKNTVFMTGICATAVTAIAMYASKQKTERLSLKQKVFVEKDKLRRSL